MRIKYTFMNKQNRDNKYKELKASGFNVIKRSIRNQLTHPQYISDFEGDEKYDTGIGNTVYKTHFDVLYIVENN